MLSMIISFGCMSPTISQSIAAMNRSLCGGFFLCFGFGSLWLSPLFMIFEMGWMTGCLWTSGVAALAFCSPVTLLSTTFVCQVTGRAVVSTRRVLMGAVGAWCVGKSADHVSGGHGVQHVPHVQHTLQPLQTPQRSMFCRSLAGMILSCHS